LNDNLDEELNEEEASLVRMSHADWLADFALSLETMQRNKGVPMTPFRLGAINRLRMAARYIAFLEKRVLLLQKQASIQPPLDPPQGESS